MRAVLPAVLFAAACSGSGDPELLPIDAGHETGRSHRFVLSAIDLPASVAEANEHLLDVDRDDRTENQLGLALGTLAALSPALDLQADLDADIDQGGNIVLVNVIADDLTTATGVGLFTFEGRAPDPSPCLGAGDTVCRQHLRGDATLAVGENRSMKGIAGRTINGRYTGNGGDLVLPIALTPATTPWLRVGSAAADLSDLTTDGFRGTLGGAIAADVVTGRILPSLGARARIQVEADCPAGGTPGCGCGAGSQGEILLAALDSAPQDCAISDAELTAAVAGLVAPDVDSDEDGTPDAMSIGVGVTAVAAFFVPPPRG